MAGEGEGLEEEREGLQGLAPRVERELLKRESVGLLE